jgi:ATP phosphoribosyltransferase
VAGLDQILEHDCTAVQALELPFGRCRMMLIGTPDAPPLTNAATIATKYPRMARRWLDDRAPHAEIIPLGGSVELAAVLRLTSHVIDLVETGETVRVHDLVLQDCVAEVTARLIVGRNVYRTNNRVARELVARVQEVTNESILA